MYAIAINVVRAAAVQAVKIAAVSGTAAVVTGFVVRRFSGEKVAKNEGKYAAQDFYEGATKIFTENPVATAAFTVAAGVAVVSPPAAAVITVIGLGAVAWDIAKDLRQLKENAPVKPRFTKEENDALNDLAKAATAAEPEVWFVEDQGLGEPYTDVPLKESFKVEADLDAKVLKQGSPKDARAYGYSWFDEHFAGKGISMTAVKKAANEALIKAGISGSRKVLFFQGMEDAAAS